MSNGITHDGALGVSALAPSPSAPGQAKTSATGLMRLQPTLLLWAGAAAAFTAAFLLGDPAVRLAADPELAALLRAMAGIKILLVLVALVALSWRLRSEISPRFAAGYLLAVWAMSAAAASVWQLSHLLLTSPVFHGGILALLVLSWRDSALRRHEERSGEEFSR